MEENIEECDDLINPFDRIPDEMLECILSCLSPYKDLKNCMSVSKRWNIIAKNVLNKVELKLYRAINGFDYVWNTMPLDNPPPITKRFSHAACVHGDFMYIFGGCTPNSTAFNDLWKFDLTKREWKRPLAMGNYPTPKAYATMLPYENNLILFGGWTHPLLSLVRQDWTSYSEIHFYNTILDRWDLVPTNDNPPPMAGHSAIIVDDTMVVFGGIHKSYQHYLSHDSNDVWVLNLKTKTWLKQATSEPRPLPRHGQSLVQLTKNHAMMLGGIKTAKQYDDCWILEMTGDIWTWHEVKVNNKEYSSFDMWGNTACKVGDKIVTIGHESRGLVPSLICGPPRNAEENSVTHRLEQNMRRLVDRDNNINGRRGILPHWRRSNPVHEPPPRPNDDPQPGPSNPLVNAFMRLVNAVSGDSKQPANNAQNENANPADNENRSNRNPNQNNHSYMRSRNPIGRRAVPNTIKIVRHIHGTDNFRMAAFATENNNVPLPAENRIPRYVPPHFLRIGDRYQEMRQPPEARVEYIPRPNKLHKRSIMLHVLDISSVLKDSGCPMVTWIPPYKGIDGAPGEVIMYSLVRGRGELIMFGGLCYSTSNLYSNTLYFITSPSS